MKLQKVARYATIASLGAVGIFSGIHTLYAETYNDTYVSTGATADLTPRTHYINNEIIIRENPYNETRDTAYTGTGAAMLTTNSISIHNLPTETITLRRVEGESTKPTIIDVGGKYSTEQIALYEILLSTNGWYTWDNYNRLTGGTKIAGLWQKVQDSHPDIDFSSKTTEEIKEIMMEYIKTHKDDLFGTSQAFYDSYSIYNHGFQDNFFPLPVKKWAKDSDYPEVCAVELDDNDNYRKIPCLKNAYMNGYSTQAIYKKTYGLWRNGIVPEDYVRPQNFQYDIEKFEIDNGLFQGTIVRGFSEWQEGVNRDAKMQIHLPALSIPDGEYTFTVPVYETQANIARFLLMDEADNGGIKFIDFTDPSVDPHARLPHIWEGKLIIKIETIPDNVPPETPKTITPPPPTVTTIDPPKNDPSGPGGYTPVTPITFHPPIFNDQCVSHVKNLDDEKLIAYYSVLDILNKDLVNESITRAEFAKLVANASLVDVNNINLDSIRQFNDVGINSWYAPYLAYAVQNSILEGQEMIDTTGNTVRIFRPYDKLTRAEAAKILVSLIKKSPFMLPSKESIHTFADISPEFPLASFVQEAYDACLLHGRNTRDWEPVNNEARRFEPHDNITVAEVSKVLYNMTHRYEK